jgi:ferredoxin, 2Fe-2S
MAGVNPYIVKPDAKRPTKPFTVTFVEEDTGHETRVDVDPATFPHGHIGQDFSILDIATEAGVDIEHSCGGVCACSTCHVKVRQGGESCSKPTDDELDMVDTARDVDLDSRLSCQCVPSGSQDLIILIPKWNKNLVKEGH